MRLFHWHAPMGNFGDDMNLWFWDDLMPGWQESPADATLIGIGSLLTTNLELPAGRRIVAGAGAGYGQPPLLEPAEDWDVRFVRGPRTAAVLGLPLEAGLTDPAALCARLPRFAGHAAPRGRRPIFVPHCYSDMHPDYDWAAICTRAGIDHVSPRGNAVGVIRTIAASPLVLAESLHAAIIADAFRVPWLPVATGVEPLKLFKWQDWCEGVGLAMPDPVSLFAPLDRVRRFLRPSRARPPRAPAPRPAAPPPAAAAGGQAAAAPAREAGFRILARDRLRAGVAANSLARAARRPGLLSRDDVLADRLDQVSERIRGLARDYGLACSL